MTDFSGSGGLRFTGLPGLQRMAGSQGAFGAPGMGETNLMGIPDTNTGLDNVSFQSFPPGLEAASLSATATRANRFDNISKLSVPDASSFLRSGIGSILGSGNLQDFENAVMA